MIDPYPPQTHSSLKSNLSHNAAATQPMKIPNPPPLGMGRVCTLRSLGTSIKPNEGAQRIIKKVMANEIARGTRNGTNRSRKILNLRSPLLDLQSSLHRAAAADNNCGLR